MNKASLDETQIRETAFLLWLDDGQPQGRDQEHWLRAIETLKMAETKAKPARKVAAKPRAASAAPKKAAKSKTGTKAKAAAKK